MSLPARPVARPAARVLAALVSLALLSGCAALPRSGPLASQIDRTEAEGELEGLVVPLTADVAARVPRLPEPNFPADFLGAGEIDPAALSVGDVVMVTIWEGAETGLFGSSGAAQIGPLAVEPDGTVSIPFVGRVRAGGASPARLRERIRAGLEPLTLSPQVDVQVMERPSRRLTVQGAVAQPGVYEIEQGLTRLTPMLAAAGGSPLPPEQVEVSLRRGALTGVEALDAVLSDPALDVALAPEDRIVLNRIDRRFVVLGATLGQSEIRFPTRDLDLLSALGAARGLDDVDANPTGVFLFRYEAEPVAAALLPGPEPEGLPEGRGRPVIYRLDLTDPESFFVARDFAMRDRDAIFVTNAPLTELRKFVSLFTAAATPLRTTTTLAPQTAVGL